MKLSYYGYYIKDNQSQDHLSFDIQPLLDSYINNATIGFKNSIIHRGERLYIKTALQGQYLFIQTNSDDLVKKINSETMSVSEIKDMLEENEQLGFASYLYVGSCFFGIASTIFAPKATALVALINKLLRQIYEDRFELIHFPLLVQSSPADVVRMPICGSVVIRGSTESKWHSRLKEAFLGGRDTDIAGFELKLIPVKGSKSNTKPVVDSVIGELSEDPEIDKLIVKAKEHENDSLSELYLHGKGVLSDTVNPRAKEPLESQIERKVQGNTKVLDKLREMLESERVINSEDSWHNIAQFTWPDTLRGI